MIRRTLATTFLAVLLATPSWADMDEALLAYSQRDYLTALQKSHPLAVESDSFALYKIGFMYFHG